MGWKLSGGQGGGVRIGYVLFDSEWKLGRKSRETIRGGRKLRAAEGTSREGCLHVTYRDRHRISPHVLKHPLIPALMIQFQPDPEFQPLFEVFIADRTGRAAITLWNRLCNHAGKNIIHSWWERRKWRRSRRIWTLYKIIFGRGERQRGDLSRGTGIYLLISLLGANKFMETGFPERKGIENPDKLC